MTSTLEFFQDILPAEGWKCLFVLPEKRHYWFTDLAEMAAHALRLDAAGSTVYHGCASFKTKSRKADNVLALKCYRIDVDAGPGKPYRDAGEAYRAVAAWVRGAGLAPPLYLASGGGVHAYWPLGVPVDGRRWRGAALGLVAALERGGLKADPTVTKDLARILRPPGTTNRKGAPVLVRAGPRVGPYAIETLEAQFGSAVGAPPPFLTKIPGVQPVFSDLEAAVANIHAPSLDDSDPALVAAACAQLRHVPESPAAGWYAIVGVFAYCGERGRQHALGLATDPKWLPTIEEKLARWRAQADGPTTCARFETLNPAPCRACPHRGKITSPIQLGRPLPAATLAPKPQTLDLPPLPDPFFWSKGQMRIRLEAKKEDEPSELIVADYPVYIAELQQGERDGGISAVFRSWEPATQSWTAFPVALKDLMGDRGRAALAHHGVAILKKRWEHFQDYMVKAVNAHRGLKKYGQRYEQFGWKADGFVIGEDLLGGVGVVRRVFGGHELERRGPDLRPRGDAGAWSLAANALFAEPAMVAHAFALLAAFAAPLYHFTGAQGAAIVHLASPNSGAGKTTALEAGESVFGAHRALQVGSRDTEVAKFIMMGVSNHLPVFWDELRYTDPEETKAYVLQVTLGRDKNRGHPDGGLRADSLPWATILIATSNPSLVDTVRYDGSETAQAARIFEIEPQLPPGKTVSRGRALEDALKANAGTAGRAYLAWLVDHRAWAEAAVHKALARYETLVGGGAEQRFIVRLLACVAVAGAVTRQLGLLSFDIALIMAWAVRHAQGGMAKLAGDNFGDIGGILGGLINDMLPYVLAMPGPVKPGPRDMTYTPIREPRGELKGRYEHDGRKLWLDERAVRTWMQKHKRSVSQTEATLCAAGVLVADRKKTLGAGTTTPSGQVRCWEIDMGHALVADKVELLAVETGNVVAMRRA